MSCTTLFSRRQKHVKNTKTIQNQLNSEIEEYKKRIPELLVKMTSDHFSELTNKYILLEKEYKHFSLYNPIQSFYCIGKLLTESSVIECYFDYSIIIKESRDKIIRRITLPINMYKFFDHEQTCDFEMGQEISCEYLSIFENYRKLLEIKKVLFEGTNRDDYYLEKIDLA